MKEKPPRSSKSDPRPDAQSSVATIMVILGLITLMLYTFF